MVGVLFGRWSVVGFPVVGCEFLVWSVVGGFYGRWSVVFMVGGRCFAFLLVGGRFLFLRMVGGLWSVAVRWAVFRTTPSRPTLTPMLLRLREMIP